MKNFKKDIIAINTDSFSEETLNAISKWDNKGYSGYLQALAKISYWFNQSGLNYDMNFVYYDGKGCSKKTEWLNIKVTG